MTGTRMFISDLEPGCDYDVVVESKARHQCQREAWDPHDPYLCKEQSSVVTFRTGHPPIGRYGVCPVQKLNCFAVSCTPIC